MTEDQRSQIWDMVTCTGPILLTYDIIIKIFDVQLRTLNVQ